MSETTIDYEKEKANKYLPESLRAFIGATNRVSRENIRTYFSMYEGVEQLAVFNNQIAAEFASGFVFSLNYRYLRSGVAPRLVKILVSKTVGRVYYQTDIPEKDLNEKFDKDYFSDCLTKGFTEAAITGRSVVAVYKDKLTEQVSLMTYNIFRHRVKFDIHKNINEAWLFLSNHQTNKFGTEYVVCEHRFYKRAKQDDGTYKMIPHQQFIVYKSIFTMESKKDARTSILDFKDIPAEVLKAYKGIDFSKDNELTFKDLGVYDIKYSDVNTKFLDLDIPEAMFVDAVDNAATIDTSITGKEVEKEIGRGQIMIPQIGNGGISGPFTKEMTGMVVMPIATRYKNPILVPYPTLKPEDSKPTNVQFDIRSEQWNNQVDNDTARLCANVGIGIIDYDARLLMSGQRTDDEINSMTDTTANTVKHFRDINTKKINDLLACVIEALGFASKIAIRWSMASIINPTRNADLVIKQLQNGLISRKEAIRRANPDLNDNEVDEMIKQIDAEKDSVAVPMQFSNF